MSVDAAERVALPGRAVNSPAVAGGDRWQVAKHVLVRAEAAAGMRTGLPTLGPPGLVPPSVAPSTASGRGGVARTASVDDRFLPVPDALVPLVPFGGLRRGSITQVEGSASLLLSLAAAACRDGAWCAVVGMPDLGLAAAAEIGLALERVAFVREPRAAVATVLAAAVDGFDVIVVGEACRLAERDRRQLSSRIRHRSAVLLTTQRWPGAELVLSVTRSRWGGVGQGAGSLRGRELDVLVTGRGAVAGRGVHGRLLSPDGICLVPGPVEPAVPGPVEPAAPPVRRAG
jgi:hypothetical protein